MTDFDLPTRWTPHRGLRGGPFRQVKRVQIDDGLYAFWLEDKFVGSVLRLPPQRYGNPQWRAYLPTEEPIADPFDTLTKAREHLLDLADGASGAVRTPNAHR